MARSCVRFFVRIPKIAVAIQGSIGCDLTSKIVLKIGWFNCAFVKISWWFSMAIETSERLCAENFRICIGNKWWDRLMVQFNSPWHKRKILLIKIKEKSGKPKIRNHKSQEKSFQFQMTNPYDGLPRNNGKNNWWPFHTRQKI